ncbi:hypothetical protein KW792_02025, partial [Candidatus Saccharibacteria bacterium]|nr:hypothetical protein [Candidatus Saccharibacteria bacterium]
READQMRTPKSFASNCVTTSAFLYSQLTISKEIGDDLGSINKFVKKNWGTEERWRKSLKPTTRQKKFIVRAFSIRNKLIAHIDLDLDKLVENDDILNLIKCFDGYVVPAIGRIFEEFLGHNQDGNLDFEDLSIQTYRLLYPLHPEIDR